jgi:FlaA1/EpsC-like NDP-sugar epimerase
VFLIAIGVTFFAKIGDQYSRIWLGSFYVAGLVVLIGFRRALFLLVRRWTREGRLDRRTVVVGADDRGDALIKSLASQRDSDVRVVGVFDDRGDDRAPDLRRAARSSAPSTIWSSSRAAPASIW